MNTQKSVLYILSTIAIVVVMVTVALSAFQKESVAQAQSEVPEILGITSGSESANRLIEVNVPLTPNKNGGDGLPEGVPQGNPEISPSGLNAIDEALATFSYYRRLGVSFNPRTSSTTYAYNFNGCVYETGGTDNRFMAPLNVPDRSILKYLRLYYDDTNAGSDLTAWITRYQPGVTSEDLISVVSNGSSGYGTTLSSEITHTVDLTSWAYTIIIAPNANSSSNSFCGVRVAYYAPNSYGVAVPIAIR